ncbi:histidinol-phosphate transaminase [Sulfitobacter aestuarii]|uniref:Histidinol-phosphate aminotransferase n=1 Tax=Sulfitobacter aestuarii TaxID=2161676 RepID=A0ABW5TZH1_9RHOB
MSSSLPAELIRKEIAALPTYNAGLAMDRFREIYGLDCLAKLDSNESPLGASPAAIAAMQAQAPGIARYPDAGNAALRAQIAESCDTTPAKVIIGNGSEDLIGALFRATLRDGDHVVTICPSFGLHEFGALACGARVTKVPFAADWRFPLSGLRDAMKEPTRILIFASPSNPAGPAICEKDFRALLDFTPQDTFIAFDEAYLEYVAQEQRFDAMAILARSGHAWIVLRTFSKAYGLAGIRVGYGIASDEELIKALMKTRNPFGVNALAVAAAREAFDDRAHLAEVIALAASERQRVGTALRKMGYDCAPSQTNFIFFDTGALAVDFAEALRGKGILIKAWLEEPFGHWARVTIGTPAENDAFLAAVPERES